MIVNKQQKKESQFLHKLKEKEKKIAKLNQERYEQARHIMEQNLSKEQVKIAKQEMDLKSDKLIDTKLQSFEKEFEAKSRKKNEQLSKIVDKNSTHFGHIRERLFDLK